MMDFVVVVVNIVNVVFVVVVVADTWTYEMLQVIG